MNLCDRELAQILAALRWWQYSNAGMHERKGDEHFEDHEPMSDEEIDALCERIYTHPGPDCGLPAIAAERFREAAKNQYEGEEGDVDFDDTPALSVAEKDPDGAYVQAWVWVSNDEVGRESS